MTDPTATTPRDSSNTSRPVLVCGATGALGMVTASLMKQAGKPVRGMVRATSDATKVSALRAMGIETVVADFKDPASLEAACRGVGAVISGVTALLSREPGDSFESVDQAGHLSLIRAAKGAGAERFVFVSVPPAPTPYAFQNAKQAVEAALRDSGLKFTIFYPAHFMEVWLSAAPPIGFDVLGGEVQLIGTGETQTNFISIHDVARFLVAAAASGNFDNKAIALGGPEPLSQLQIVRIFEQLGCPSVKTRPSLDLAAAVAHARSPNEQALCMAMLALAHGLRIDPELGLSLLPGRLITVRDHATRLLNHRS